MSTVGFYFSAEQQAAGEVDAQVKAAIEAAEAAAAAALLAAQAAEDAAANAASSATSASDSSDSATDSAESLETIDISLENVVRNVTTGIPNSLPVLNFVYGTDATPASLPEGSIYIKVDTGE